MQFNLKNSFFVFGFSMADFCDECGESFPTTTSKFCGNCGKKRVFGNVEVALVEPLVVRENTTIEEETRDSLWVVLEYSGNLTLYEMWN